MWPFRKYVPGGPVPCSLCGKKAWASVLWCGHGSSGFSHVVKCPLREEHPLCRKHKEAVTAEALRHGHGKRLRVGTATRRHDSRGRYQPWPCEPGCRYRGATATAFERLAAIEWGITPPGYQLPGDADSQP